MKQQNQTLQRRILVSAVLMALAGTVSAQTPAGAQNAPSSNTNNAASQAKKQKKNISNRQAPTEMQAVVVQGIASSLEASMNIKRFSNGIVDGIVAEDIGKFPDTNLAEALQRIPGVSIDRVNGEGARVTVRGIGPQFNLVLLNGRLMPTANIAATSASTDRSFDFAQLSSSAVSEVDVYKTGEASTPPGGMGATINIITARPFDHPGTHGAVSVQGMWDGSNQHIPSSLKYGNLAPRVNGIFSTTSDNGEFGFGINGSYEKRNFGYSTVSVDGWRLYRGSQPYDGAWGGLPPAGSPNVVNPPGPNTDYAFPQALRYDVNGSQSTRVNGQVVLQYKPSDNLVNTLDYTYSEYKIQHRFNELSAWFSLAPTYSSWTNGPIAAPLVYSETYGTPQDVAMAGGQDATKETLKSIGWNTKWKVNDVLSFTLDAHHSTAQNGADSPWGSNAIVGTAAYIRGTSTANFTGSLPLLNTQFAPAGTQLDPSQMLLTGSSFRNSYMRSTVNQVQLNGNYVLPDDSELNFGVASTDVQNRTAYSFVEQDNWGGFAPPSSYSNSLWHPANMGDYFTQFSGHNSSFFTDQFYLWNFGQVRQAGQQAWVANGGSASMWRASPNFTTDMRTREKSKSAFMSWDQTYYPADHPLRVSVGVRYEKTDVTSKALVPTYTGVQWVSANELYLIPSGQNGFTQLKGSYKYFLPALNLSYNITDDMKVRAAYSETIGRPNWGEIQGGQQLATSVRFNGGSGSQGNPGLKPLVSHNIDLSWAWYYGKGSYVSVDFFRKNIDNYVGTKQVTETPFNLHTPIGGTYYNAAITNGGCASTDPTCIRNYIFANYNGQPGVDASTNTIIGQPGDPVTPFLISEPTNTKSTSLHGWEFSLQQMLWDTGFGAQVNYTIVQSPLHYNNYSYAQQFVLVGLSNSANFVGFYEKGPWQARVAYNWRAKFLSGTFDGLGDPNPIYTAPFGQWDISASYNINKRLSITLDGINVTNRTQRIYTRNIHELVFAEQTGPRYMLGVRYKF